MKTAATWFLRLYVPCILLFIYAPVASLTLMSFHEGEVPSFPVEDFSSKWYGDAWRNRDFREGLETSLMIGSAVAAISTVIGFVSAYVLCRVRPARALLYVAFVCLPCLIPLLLSGMALQMYYERIRLAGSIWAIILAHSCFCAPFAMGLIRNSYDGLNEEIEQAAANLGAGRIRVILRVVVPQLWPSILSATAVSFLLSWDEFMMAWFVGGFTKTLPTVIYSSLATSLNPSAYAIGVLSMGVSAALLFVIVALMFIHDRRRRRLA